MALSWTGAVALANKIASDVPAVKTMLDALAKMDFTGITSIPANVKRIASVTGGVQLQKYASNAWSSIGKLMHDVDTVDGFHAGTGTAKNTIPVRDANGALPGNITGNAATASKASDLADGYTVPLAKGGTGATTAAAARANLGSDNAANITKGTLPTARGGTGRTDGFVTDVVIDASGTKAKDVGQLGRAKSLSRVDANTILKHGRYNVYYATTALHFPLPGDLLLDVIVWGDDNITQICSSPSNAYKFEMVRTSYDNGATWGGWLPRSGFLNADIHIYVSKDGDDTNAGYSADKPVLTLTMAVYKMLMMKPGVGKAFYLHFGPGEWGNLTLYGHYASGAPVVVTTLAAANSATAPADMPKFGTLAFSRYLLAYVRNIEADMVDSAYDACTYVQHYNKIGSLRARYGGRLLLDASSVTAIKAQTLQLSCLRAYRVGVLDILNGATFDVLEAVSYSDAFCYINENSHLNVGSTITAASFKNAARVTGKKFHFVSAEIVDPNTRRTLFPGTAAGTYGNGNLINGMATDVTVDGTLSDTAVKRGQIGACPHFDATVKKDIDTLAASGSYSLNNSDGLHLPDGVNFYVDVMSSSHGFVRQVLYRQGTVGTNDHRVFTRESADRGKTWGDYARFLMDKDMASVLTNDGGKVPSSAAVYNAALLKNGGTLTGNVAFPVNEDEADVKTLRLGVRAVDTDGTARTFFPFRIIPGSTTGRGLVFNSGGPLILGGGESAQTFAKGHIAAGKLNGGTEYTYITSDNGIELYYGQNAAYDGAKKIAISAAGDMSMPGTITASKFNGCATGLGARDFADAQSGTNSPSVVYGVHPDGKIRPFALDRIVPLDSKLVPDWGGRATRVLNTYYSETVNGLLFLHWSIGTSWKYLKFLIANNDGTYGEYEIAHSYNSASANGSMTIPIEKGRSYGFFAKNGDGNLITDISITCRFMKTK